MEENKQQEPKVFIHIEFTQPNSTEFSVVSNAISPLQLLMLSQYFEFMGKSSLSQMQAQAYQRALEEQARNKIVKPGETGLVSGDEARALWNTLKE